MGETRPRLTVHELARMTLSLGATHVVVAHPSMGPVVIFEEHGKVKGRLYGRRLTVSLRELEGLDITPRMASLRARWHAAQ